MKLKFSILFFILISLLLTNNNILINNTNYVRIENQNEFSMDVELIINAINFENTNINNETYTNISFENSYPSTKDIGSPNLPSFNSLIEIPRNAEIVIELIDSKSVTYNLEDYNINNLIVPVQPPISKSESQNNINFEFNENLYSKNEFYSKDLIKINKKGLLRELEIANIIINPIEYNPIENKIKVYHTLKFKLEFINADIELSQNAKNRTFSPYFESIFQTSITNYNSIFETRNNDYIEDVVSYIIIADQSFENALNPFIEWKTQKGFHVTVAYTNQIGSSATNIKNYLQNQYDNPPNNLPAPSFVLIVGDTQQIPASYSSGGHVSDLDYCDFTNDNLPDVLCGRFSAQNPSHLTNQINKTIEYEKYEMADPSFLSDVLMISGVDASYAPTYGNGQINYGNNYYFNSNHNINSNTFLYPASGSSGAQILNLANQGAAYINYTAHGWEDGWADPAFDNGDANSMTNNGKYPTMVGNCCLTNAFDTGACFGETLLRKANGGAIGYIGGSDVTYWNEDYWWGVGSGNITANPSYNNTGPGVYDGMFHENNENNWAVVNGAISIVGNLAVAQANGMDDYYWEIYHLMGDPSLSTYLGVPSENQVSHDIFLPIGSEAIEIQAEPFSYIGLSQNNSLLSSGTVDQSGFVVLVFDPLSQPGTIEIVVTAQNKEPYFNEIFVSSPNGPYVTMNNIDLDSGNDNLISIGETININATLENLGSENASDIVVNLVNSNNDGYIDLINSNAIINNLNDNESANISLSFRVNNGCPYGYISSLLIELNSENNSISEEIVFQIESLIESFDSASFDEFLWEFSGNQDWNIVGSQFIGDSYSAKSGDIDDNMTSEIFITMNIVEDGFIKFDKKVSCEDVGSQTGNYYDYLAFYIDNIEQAKWAGEIDWSQNSFEVSAGERTFSWKFIKDQGVTSGQDAAWIDNIVFPPSFYEGFMIGDLNSDNYINIQDVIIAVGIVLGNAEYVPSGDLNGDNVINVTDIVQLVNLILN